MPDVASAERKPQIEESLDGLYVHTRIVPVITTLYYIYMYRYSTVLLTPTQ